jgi:hypothetical protein
VQVMKINLVISLVGPRMSRGIKQTSIQIKSIKQHQSITHTSKRFVRRVRSCWYFYGRRVIVRKDKHFHDQTESYEL